MKKSFILLILLILTGVLFLACPGPGSKPDPEPEDPQIAELEETVLPEGFNPARLSTEAVDVPHAALVPAGYRVLGQAWDVRYGNADSTDFGDELAELRFSVDLDAVTAEGMITDFQGFFYNEEAGEYQPVDGTLPDIANSTVTLYTSHLTIFIITALEPSSDNVQEAPAAVADTIFTADTGLILSPVPIIIDENFEYYRDRDYYIRPWNDPADPDYSAENARVMDELGLNGSLGLATYNGGQVAGYPLDEHKLYTGDDYMAFTAARDLEVFVMYDCRGGADRFDFTQDADWLRSGFQVRRDGSDQPYFIQTTDTVGYYTVYSRTYTAGENVRLHGNRRGVTDPGINTNYWVMIKPAGCPPEDNGFDAFIPEGSRPDPVTNLTARPDAGDILLEWLLPAELPQPDSWILVRRSTSAFPRTPYEGTEPAGTAVGDTAFRDTSAPTGADLYYSVFILDANELPSRPAYCGLVNDGSGTVLPAVTGTLPANGESGVNPGNVVAVTFNKPMNETMLTAANIRLKTGTVEVPAAVSYNADTRTVIIDPDDPLATLTDYYIVVAAEVEDADGYPLNSVYSGVFTTSNSAAGGELDITVILGITDPEPVTVTGFVSTMTEADTMSLTAAVDAPDGTEVYKWFVNGEETSVGASAEISGLRKGHYRLDVIAYRSDVPVGGYTGLFEVTE